MLVSVNTVLFVTSFLFDCACGSVRDGELFTLQALALAQNLTHAKACSVNIAKKFRPDVENKRRELPPKMTSFLSLSPGSENRVLCCGVRITL